MGCSKGVKIMRAEKEKGDPEEELIRVSSCKKGKDVERR